MKNKNTGKNFKLHHGLVTIIILQETVMQLINVTFAKKSWLQNRHQGASLKWCGWRARAKRRAAKPTMYYGKVGCGVSNSGVQDKVQRADLTCDVTSFRLR